MYDEHQYDLEGHCHGCGEFTTFSWADVVVDDKVVPGWACQLCGKFHQRVNRVSESESCCETCGKVVRSSIVHLS